MNQMTLVTLRERKPLQLIKLIEKIHEKLFNTPSIVYEAYSSRQIHSTVLGLEYYYLHSKYFNRNFRIYRNELKEMKIDEFLTFTRETNFFPMLVRIGGFSEQNTTSFRSHGQPFYERMFSIQQQHRNRSTVVLMGWPVIINENDIEISLDLDIFRREAAKKFNILHKYHQKITDIDNDLYMVLGQILGPVSLEVKTNLENMIRSYLKDNPIHVLVKNLAIVVYEDESLPIHSSRSLNLSNFDTIKRYLKNN